MAQSKQHLWVMLSLVSLIVVITLVHLSIYGGRNYREDEINSIHGALTKDPSGIVEWMSTDLHPPGWRLFADFWIDAFGTDEPITRWSSTLLNLLTFALLFQLGRQLYDWRMGLFAVILLGLYAIPANAMNELRPYPMLIMLSVALHLVFYRWLHKPDGKLMIAYVLLGIATLYTHFFSIFVFAGHVTFALLFLKWNRQHWIHTVSIWLFIGLSFLGWILPFVHTITVPFRGGIYYALPEGLIGIQLLIERLDFNPIHVGYFLLLFGLCTPLLAKRNHESTTVFRFAKYSFFAYPFILLVAIILIALFANSIVSSLTPRNMLIITPLIALIMAFGLRLLPIQAGLILVAILFVDAPQQLQTQTSNAPYREMMTFVSESYTPDSVLLTEFSEGWRWLTPASYVFMDFTPDKMSKQRMVHVVDSDDDVYLAGNFPELLVNILQNDIDSNDLNAVVPNTGQLWHLQQGGGTTEHNSTIQQWLRDNYALLRTIEWAEPYVTTYTLSEYVRVPDDSRLMLSASDTLELFAWTMRNSVDVTPCQTITVENWWQTQLATSNPLQVQLILADDNGQIAIGENFPSATFTTDWLTNTYYRDLTPLTIPCDISAGSYNLLLGVKDSITGESLPLMYPGGGEIGTLYYLTTLNTQGN